MLEILQASAQSLAERWIEPIFKAFVGAGIPAIGWLINNRRRARRQMLEEKEKASREMKEEQEKVRADLEAKHKENTKRMDQQDEKLEEILNERKYIQPHMHREINGPLTAENIHYPRR